MEWCQQRILLTAMASALLSLACGSEAPVDSPDSAGASGGGTAGMAGASASGGASGASGASGGGSGGGGAPVDPGLDCSTPDVLRGNPIPCNGACLADPGDDHAGCRVLMRSFIMSSLVVDGDTVFVSDAPIEREPDTDLESGGASRIAIFDRASRSLVGQIQPERGRPHVRAVSPTQIAFMNIGDVDLSNTLRVAPRGTGEIAESNVLDTDLRLDSINDPREKVWFQGDTLYYQEHVGWDLALRSVPLAGGEITVYPGLVRDVVEFPSLLAFGAQSEFDSALRLMQLAADAAPVVVGDPVTDNRYDRGELQTDASFVYFLRTTNTALTLIRAGRDGQSPTELATYDVATIVGSGSDGFIVHDRRYLRLIPLDGQPAVEIADLGSARGVAAAAFVDDKAIVVAESRGILSHYLLEIDLP